MAVRGCRRARSDRTSTWCRNREALLRRLGPRPELLRLGLPLLLAGREADGEVADFHGPAIASPPQPAVHDQAAADSFIEDADHHEVGLGVVGLVDGQHRQGVDVVFHDHRDGLAEAGVGLEEAVQRGGQGHRRRGAVAQMRHDLAVVDGRAHFDAHAEHPQWLQPAGGPVLVTSALEGGHVVVDQLGGLVPAVGPVVRYAEGIAVAVQAEQRRCHLPGLLA